MLKKKTGSIWNIAVDIDIHTAINDAARFLQEIGAPVPRWLVSCLALFKVEIFKQTSMIPLSSKFPEEETQLYPHAFLQLRRYQV